ncbi:hypothetical protein Nepgr_032912 [Nepenthes gracilis]|uniref:Uncharacterized protein n=1 Tax=Nepenthes gracilis TaxID=150966 RepID=A0AAD3TL08_NEPGR|nr:hypothetical protein Nepgr_032912 [Nepenthes gracilis]
MLKLYVYVKVVQDNSDAALYQCVNSEAARDNAGTMLKLLLIFLFKGPCKLVLAGENTQKLSPWWEQLPTRWVIVLLCFTSFLLCHMDRANKSIARLPKSQEFNWKSAIVSLISNFSFWGYLLTQIVGTLGVDKIGGKLVLGFGVIGWSVAIVLTPIAARINLPCLLILCVIMGMGEGVAMPDMNNIISILGGSNSRGPVILSRAPVWALKIGHFCHTWGTIILLTWVPTYYNQVLKFHLMESGLVAVLPWLTRALFAYVRGWMADTLVTRGLAVTSVWKIMQSIEGLGPVFLFLLLSQMKPPVLAVLSLSFRQGLDAFSQSGLYFNYQDIGPRYSSIESKAFRQQEADSGGSWEPDATVVNTDNFKLVSRKQKEKELVLYVNTGKSRCDLGSRCRSTIMAKNRDHAFLTTLEASDEESVVSEGQGFALSGARMLESSSSGS